MWPLDDSTGTQLNVPIHSLAIHILSSNYSEAECGLG